MSEPEQYPPTLEDGHLPGFLMGSEAPTETVGDYELLEVLAQGGMGIVYRARQRSLNRVVALKMLLSGRVTSEVGRARFRAEAEATAELDHPNIVPIFEVGEHGGRLFFSMKLIDGGTFSDFLRKSPKPPLRELMAVFAKVCRAVQYAHLRGILHRDLKPSNVLIDNTGEPYVADFGLAKRLGSDDGLTMTGAILGTPAYMAPEQAGDGIHSVTTLTDVYALGAILYEVLTGRPPFAAREIDILLAQIRSEEPLAPSRVSPETPRDLELICLRCLAKEPGQRYASAGELADELERWLRGEPVLVRAPGFVSRIVIWARHNSRAALWVVLIGVVWGLFGLQLPLALRVYSGPVQRASRALDGPLHSEQPNGPGFVWTYLWLLLLPLAILIHFSSGMLTYLATRSRDRWAHLGGGVAVGLIGGVIAFTLYIGPAFVLILAIVPSTPGLNTLGLGFATKQASTLNNSSEADASQNQSFRLSRFFLEPDQRTDQPRIHPQDQLVEQYPEFAEVPEELRGYIFVAKLRAQNFVGIFKGIALGMLVTLVTAMPLGIGGAAFAGFAVQRCGSVRAAISLYLEMYAILSLVIVAFVVVILSVSIGWLTHTVKLAMLFLLVLFVVFAILGMLGRWQQRDRWVGYWVGLGAVALPSQLQDDWQLTSLILLFVFTPALAVLLWQRLRTRPAAATPTTVTTSDQTSNANPTGKEGA